MLRSFSDLHLPRGHPSTASFVGDLSPGIFFATFKNSFFFSTETSSWWILRSKILVERVEVGPVEGVRNRIFFFSLTWSRGYGDSLTAGFCDKASLLLSTCFPLKEVDTVY